MRTATFAPGAARQTRLLLGLLWLAFLVRGFWYCALLPPWEGYDEPFHFAVLQHVASSQGMPHAGSPISLEVQKSLHLLPLPWELHLHAIPQPLLPHDEYWRLPPSERERRIAAVRSLPPGEGSQPASEPIANYEAQQPPLYYWLFAVPMRWMDSPLLSRVYLLRMLNTLSASVAAPLAFWIAKGALGSEAQALAATAIVVLLPELMINIARVGNESLALVCYSAMLASALMAMRRPLSGLPWVTLGTLLALGLLTKAYVLSAVPAVVFVAVVTVWQPCRMQGQIRPPDPASIAGRLAAAIAIAMLIAGRWHLGVHRSTGSWTGVKDEIVLSHLSFMQKLAQVPYVNWKSGFLSILNSHVWFGAWSFLRVPVVVYVVAFDLIALSASGVVLRLRRRQDRTAEVNDILVLAAFYAGFWAGLLYDVLAVFLSKGVSASAGWYLYAAVAAEVVLLVWGLQAFLPARLVFTVLAACIAALDLYGLHALMMPYYTGLTSHVGRSVSPAMWPALANLPVVFARLSQCRPAWLNAPTLVAWWLGYWIATLGTIMAVIALFRKPKSIA